jgi:REP element-mobilizing transposase RayT
VDHRLLTGLRADARALSPPDIRLPWFSSLFPDVLLQVPRRVFVDPAAVDLVMTHIVRAAGDDHFAIAAYCFMPDHLHVLIEAQSESSDCRRFISRAKQLSGFHHRKAFRHGLWQRYSFEHVLRDDEDMPRIARYILENPVRGGLVSRVHDYPFVGSQMFTIDEILEGTSG